MQKQIHHFTSRLRRLFSSRRAMLACAAVVVVGIAVLPKAAHAMSLGSLVASLLSNLLYGLTLAFGKLMPLVFAGIIDVAKYNDFLNSRAVELGWVICRDIVNMIFVISMLVIAIGSILGLERYQWTKVLPKMLLMVIVVNFSKTICGIFIDASQVVMLTFVNALRDTAAGNMTRAFQLYDLLYFSPQIPGDAGISDWQLVATVLVGMLLLLAAFVLSLAILISLVTRVITLWVLIILSPFAFTGSVLPKTDEWAKKWWDKFTNLLVAGPALAFFLWIALYIGTQSTQQIKISDATTSGPAVSQEAAISRVATTEGLVSFLITAALLMAGLSVAKDMGGIAGSIAGDFMGKVTSFGLGAVTGGLGALAAVGKAPFQGAGMLGKWAGGLGLARLEGRTGLVLRPSWYKETLAKLNEKTKERLRGRSEGDTTKKLRSLTSWTDWKNSGKTKVLKLQQAKLVEEAKKQEEALRKSVQGKDVVGSDRAKKRLDEIQGQRSQVDGEIARLEMDKEDTEDLEKSYNKPTEVAAELHDLQSERAKKQEVNAATVGGLDAQIAALENGLKALPAEALKLKQDFEKLMKPLEQQLEAAIKKRDGAVQGSPEWGAAEQEVVRLQQAMTTGKGDYKQQQAVLEKRKATETRQLTDRKEDKKEKQRVIKEEEGEINKKIKEKETEKKAAEATKKQAAEVLRGRLGDDVFARAEADTALLQDQAARPAQIFQELVKLQERHKALESIARNKALSADERDAAANEIQQNEKHQKALEAEQPAAAQASKTALEALAKPDRFAATARQRLEEKKLHRLEMGFSKEDVQGLEAQKLHIQARLTSKEELSDEERKKLELQVADIDGRIAKGNSQMDVVDTLEELERQRAFLREKYKNNPHDDAYIDALAELEQKFAGLMLEQFDQDKAKRDALLSGPEGADVQKLLDAKAALRKTQEELDKIKLQLDVSLSDGERKSLESRKGEIVEKLKDILPDEQREELEKEKEKIDLQLTAPTTIGGRDALLRQKEQSEALQENQEKAIADQAKAANYQVIKDRAGQVELLDGQIKQNDKDRGALAEHADATVGKSRAKSLLQNRSARAKAKATVDEYNRLLEQYKPLDFRDDVEHVFHRMTEAYSDGNMKEEGSWENLVPNMATYIRQGDIGKMGAAALRLTEQNNMNEWGERMGMLMGKKGEALKKWTFNSKDPKSFKDMWDAMAEAANFDDHQKQEWYAIGTRVSAAAEGKRNYSFARAFKYQFDADAGRSIYKRNNDHDSTAEWLIDALKTGGSKMWTDVPRFAFGGEDYSFVSDETGQAVKVERGSTEVSDSGYAAMLETIPLTDIGFMYQRNSLPPRIIEMLFSEGLRKRLENEMRPALKRKAQEVLDKLYNENNAESLVATIKKKNNIATSAQLARFIKNQAKATEGVVDTLRTLVPKRHW